MEKEPWGSSTEKAKTLTIETFGLLDEDEAKEIARPIRTAYTFAEARGILEDMVNRPMTSRSSLVAALSNNSVKKILSGPAVKDSMNRDAHLLAVANMDKLFSNAIEPWKFELNPNKNNDNISEIHRLYAPLQYINRIIAVKITVKEMKNNQEGSRIYSVEAIDAEINNPAARIK